MQYTKEELDSIIERHQHYLRHDCEGWLNMRADLSGAILDGADLDGANLSEAELCGANLDGADLCRANLCRANLYGDDLYGANLSGADLSRADLRRANLSEAKLIGANLSGAKLSEAKLIGAYLSRANLSRAKLSRANLSGDDLSRADLIGADLIGAELSGANLIGANLSGAKLSEEESPRLGQILDKAITGYKKSLEGTIITATIPAGAIVFSINNSKCRTNRARIIDMGGAELLHSSYDRSFEYRLFQDIEIKHFNLIYNVECASGFHFFRTRKEAENY